MGVLGRSWATAVRVDGFEAQTTHDKRIQKWPWGFSKSGHGGDLDRGDCAGLRRGQPFLSILQPREHIPPPSCQLWRRKLSGQEQLKPGNQQRVKEGVLPPLPTLQPQSKSGGPRGCFLKKKKTFHSWFSCITSSSVLGCVAPYNIYYF